MSRFSSPLSDFSAEEATHPRVSAENCHDYFNLPSSWSLVAEKSSVIANGCLHFEGGGKSNWLQSASIVVAKFQYENRTNSIAKFDKHLSVIRETIWSAASFLDDFQDSEVLFSGFRILLKSARCSRPSRVL